MALYFPVRKGSEVIHGRGEDYAKLPCILIFSKKWNNIAPPMGRPQGSYCEIERASDKKRYLL